MKARPAKITKVLVANRGEIAVRVMRTCREMGLPTVAVYSEPDRHALHVRSADEAVLIGPAAAAKSYLSVDAILAAAKATGADAIHPGYGFLSENADFAKRCQDEGIVFIGPSHEPIRKMGEKIPSKMLMKKAGVPVVPGYDGEDQSLARLKKEAKAIGYPVLVKASAGGGGKGMKLVRTDKELDDKIESAQREAQKAFGSSAVLLEKYLEGARHVEVQVFGDRHGNAIHLNERDCSLQRRHQKILEESPSPAVSPELRKKLCGAAVTAAKAIGYDNAGTVEFMLDKSGEFYFLEMNTRLQVEHPVTEMTTGLDLVRWQIDIAGGKPLPLKQEEVPLRGHAVEVRLYAEDAARGFAPASGRLLQWSVPTDVAGVRVDSGVAKGSVIGIEYDPMLAKVIAHGVDREEALRKLDAALGRIVALGLTTNKDFLRRLIADPRVKAGDVSTNYVESVLDRWLTPPEERAVAEAAVVAVLSLHWRRKFPPEVPAGIPVGYRNNPYRYPSKELEFGDRKLSVSYFTAGDGVTKAFCGDAEYAVRLVEDTGGGLRVELNGRQRHYAIARDGETLHVGSADASVTFLEAPRFPFREEAVRGGVRAPMTGRVTKIFAAVGQKVSVGDPILVLEAMKMEQTVHAVEGGTLSEVLVKIGETVEMGLPLVKMAEAAPPA